MCNVCIHWQSCRKIGYKLSIIWVKKSLPNFHQSLFFSVIYVTACGWSNYTCFRTITNFRVCGFLNDVFLYNWVSNEFVGTCVCFLETLDRHTLTRDGWNPKFMYECKLTSNWAITALYLLASLYPSSRYKLTAIPINIKNFSGVPPPRSSFWTPKITISGALVYNGIDKLLLL